MADQLRIGPNNLPYTMKDMGDGTYAPTVYIAGGSSGGTTLDRELVTTTYRVKTAFTGASVGDALTATRVLDLATSTPTQVGSTIWYNETTAATLSSAPSAANLETIGASALTDAQLRASAVSVTTTGNVAAAGADSGNPVKVGGVYYSSKPVYTTGQRSDIQTDSRGNLATVLFGSDGITAAGVATLTADGIVSASTAGINSRSFSYVYDSVAGTWTRTRGDTNGLVVAGNVANSGTDAGNPVKIGGVYNPTRPTYTAGQRGDAQIDSKGNLGVTLFMPGSQSTIEAGQNNADSGTPSAVGLEVKGKNYVFNGTTWDRKRGDVNGSWTIGNVASAATDAGNPVKVGAVYNATLPTVTTGQRVDAQADTRGSIRTVIMGVDNNVGAAVGSGGDGQSNGTIGLIVNNRSYVFNGTTWDRAKGDTTGAYVVLKPGTSGGLTNARVTAAASTNATTVKASAGQLYGVSLYNNAAYAVFLKLYNKASNPAPGTDVPVWTIQIPAGGSREITRPTGVEFTTGIAYVITQLVADTDTTATAAGDVTGALHFK